MKNTVLFWLILLIGFRTIAQPNFRLDPRSEGRGNTFSTETQIGSLFVNPSGTGRLERLFIVLSGQNIAGPDGVHSSGIAFAAPGKLGVIGFVFQNQGDQFLAQSQAGLNWCQRLGIGQLGLRGSWLQTSVEGQKAIHSFMLDFSGMVELSPNISVGAGISNLTKSKYGDYEQIPVTGSFGIDLNPVSSFHLAIEVEKDLSQKPEYKAGCSYLVKDKIEIRTGINTQPLRQTFGLGLILKRFDINWSIANLPGLGSKQSISLSYKTLKRKSA